MAKDAELDRLKVAQDLAFQRKQDAYREQDNAWKRRSNARDAMNRAYEDKQRAYAAQNESWQEVERIRSANGPRIDSLNTQQERAFENMKAAFDSASAAYNRRDGAAASSYATSGHDYKAEAKGCVEDRRRLVQEIRDARERHDDTKPAFQQAKEAFASAKRTYDQAKSQHESTQTKFKNAKVDFDKAAKAFKDQLEKVRADNKKRKGNKRSLAEKAGVPYEFRDSVWVSKQSDGTVNIYFSGVGKPNGLGHGHYVMNASGEVTYRRNPHEPHGAQNFTEPVYWNKVKMSFDRDAGTYQTDNYIGIVGEKGQKSKAHIAINPDGDIVFVRDLGGEVLYDKKNNRGNLPDNLNWSK